MPVQTTEKQKPVPNGLFCVICRGYFNVSFPEFRKHKQRCRILKEMEEEKEAREKEMEKEMEKEKAEKEAREKEAPNKKVK